MTEIAHSIDLNLPQKLRDRAYRRKFFWAESSAKIAADLIALRRRRGLNQTELAEVTGTKQPAISRAEQADYQNWNLNTLRSIADALDARIRVLIEPSEDILREYDGDADAADAEGSAELADKETTIATNEVTTSTLGNYLTQLPGTTAIFTELQPYLPTLAFGQWGLLPLGYDKVTIPLASAKINPRYPTLTTALTQNEAQLTQLQEIIDEKEKQIENLNSTIKKKREELASLNSTRDSSVDIPKLETAPASAWTQQQRPMLEINFLTERAQ